MRVTGGTFRGRRLRTPASKHLRPALERVREAMFNILRDRLAGAKVLDAFAGTGMLGLECLSRDAAHVTFIELHRPTAARLADVLEEWGLRDRSALEIGDFLRLARRLATEGPYDLVFLDPPYPKHLVDRSLEVTATSGLVAADGLVVVKQHRKEELVVPAVLQIRDQRLYGDSKVTLLAVNKEGTQ